MTSIPVSERYEARNAALDGLARLRAAFPLEARIEATDSTSRRDYARILAGWLRGSAPPSDCIPAESRAALTALDALVASGQALGCYPFSARATGIVVALPSGRVHAMCAVDALAIARLAETAIEIEASCSTCATSLHLKVEANGGLDHDQADRARVIWKTACATAGSCSENLCRNLLFLCPACEPPPDSICYTLPQAAIIGNSFFSFQRNLIAGLSP